MYFDKRATSFSGSSIYHLLPFVIALALTGAHVLTGCDSTDATDATEPENQIADIVISPDSASIAVGEYVDFSAVALTASGDTVQNATLDVTWESTAPTVFTVEDNGVAIGQDPGTAFCTVEVSDEVASKVARRFVGRDSAFVLVF